MDEEFVAGGGQSIEGGGGDVEIGEGLPAVHRHRPAVAGAAAAQIEHKAASPDALAELREHLRQKAALGAEKSAGDDDVRGPGLNPCLGVVGVDTAADLHAARPSGESSPGSLVVAGAELDDVAAPQPVGPVALGEPGGAVLRDEVGAQGFPAVGEGAADDLFHPAVVEIDAGAEVSHGPH